MNREEAKYILAGYHLSGGDAQDPQFRDALELLNHDSELASWFAQELTIDTIISDKLRSLPVPSDLEGQLLAARKVVPVRAWWQRPAWSIAAAACFVLALTFAVFFARPPQQESFAAFRSYVAETAANLDRLDLETSDLVKIRDWLGNHHAPENFAVPNKLNGKSSVGCRVFEWNGRKVSLVCFQLDDKRVAHLFVMDRAALGNLPLTNAPQFQTSADGIATASWTDERRVYVVAMEHGEPDLKRLFL